MNEITLIKKKVCIRYIKRDLKFLWRENFVKFSYLQYNSSIISSLERKL